MKLSGKLAVKSFCLCLCLFGLYTNASPAVNESDEKNSSADKTLSPYFLVLSDSPDTDQLPLKSTRADVAISGMMAQVKVTQVYKNAGKNTLEAVYVFPASTRAAVYALKMTVGERVIEAKIKEREQARKDYEQALQEGKTASLLEQQRPNVFQMNVGNILPGDEIKVELFYTELLVPEKNVYEFVYPTVVGPRYSNVKESGAPDTEKWVKNPYLHQGPAAPFTFGLELALHSGIPISQVSSSTHEVEIKYADPQTAQVVLKPNAEAGNRDFVLKYSLAGEQIASGVLLYPGQEENFFLMMMEPPKRVEAKKIVPREYIFIIDVSGSMYGFPLDTTKALMQNLFSGLRPNDFFNVLLFSGGNSVLSEKSLPATPENIRKALEVVNNQSGGGGTELMPALKRALSLPRAEGTSRSVIIATDGYVSVEKDAFEYIRQNLGKANLFAFGIGSSVNRFLIEGMARAGMGEPFIVLNPGKAPEQADKFKDYIASPLLTEVRAKFKGFQAYDVEPEALPDLFAQRPLILFGKYKGQPEGEILITGETTAGKFEKALKLDKSLLSSENSALRYLWARHRIMQLADGVKLSQEDAKVKEVTQLGLKYNLMTDYTSFVAIDTVVRTDGNKIVTVKQPLPLPRGVSDYAVGGGQGYAAQGAAMTRACAESFAPREDKKVVYPKQPAAKSAKANVSGQAVAVKGALPETEIQKTLETINRSLKQAYQQALSQDPNLQGSITIEWVIEPSGKTKEIKLLQDGLKNDPLYRKLLKLIRELQFISSQAETRVQYCFTFTVN